VLDMDDTYEEAYEILIGNLAAEGRVNDAERIYEQCKKAFRREYKSDPPAWMRTLLTPPSTRQAARSI
jgi:pentatricopeptide repeat protein